MYHVQEVQEVNQFSPIILPYVRQLTDLEFKLFTIACLPVYPVCTFKILFYLFNEPGQLTAFSVTFR